MKKYIKLVTVTGASDDTSFDDMYKIQQDFPFVEWGILLSRRQAGRSWRFPSNNWLDRLYDYAHPLNLSGHLCGDYVKEILMGEIPNDLNDILNGSYKRIQINTHGIPHKFDIDKFHSVLKSYPDKQFIFQYDTANSLLISLTVAANISNVAALYDMSHGAGILPNEWNKPLDGIYTGYAGGLSPNNLESQLEILDKIVPLNSIIWIDAETHLRSDDDHIFDLNKVMAFLDISQSRIYGSS
jgi:hypothetical protein